MQKTTQRKIDKIVREMSIQTIADGYGPERFYVEGTEYSLRARLDAAGVEYTEEDILYGVERMRAKTEKALSKRRRYR